jgi:FkbM family methyltransferase
MPMIPAFIDRALDQAPGEIGSWYAAYKDYRWGDPYARLVSSLADASRLAVDVGAHFGEYTFFMRLFSKRCVAFECNPALVRKLQDRFGNTVDIMPFALSNREGTAELRIPQSSAGTGLGRATIEAANVLKGDFSGVDLVTVRTAFMDDVIGNRPVGLIKVDVEGHEMAVLEGAKRILERDRPNLILELEDRHNPGCVKTAFEFLEGFGYRGFYLQGRRLVPATPKGASPGESWNFVFKPRN